MSYSTKQYQAVLRCLEARAGEALTAADLAESLRRAGSPVGLATIYRQLEKLEKAGRVHKAVTGEGAVYQYCTHLTEAHDCFLLRCDSCGKITHLGCAQLQGLYDHLESAHHFRVDLRRTVLTGKCRTCAEREESHGAQ